MCSGTLSLRSWLACKACRLAHRLAGAACLEAAAVGDERQLAVHEGVQAAGRLHHVGPRVQK